MPKIDWQLWQIAIAAAVGLVTTILGFRTFFWQRMQMRTWLQTEQFQNDSHTLRLCEALNESSPRLQLAAAALLFERLKQKDMKAELDRERSAIIQALLAATIGNPHSSRQATASPELCKYIADAVIEALDAKISKRKQSPLREYYWQKVQFADAYWAQVDARGVDFYGASFDRASLRRANLEGTVFYDASLVGAKLMGASLKNADLRGANLSGADLRDDDRGSGDVRKTEWSGIKLAGAKYNSKTAFPPDLNPQALGMVLADPRPAPAAA